MKITPDENLTQALVAMSNAPAATQQAMQQAAIDAVSSTWTQQLAASAGTAAEQRMLVNEAGSDIGPTSITLVAGAGGPLSGGLENWPAIEFGMTPVQIIAPTRRRKIRIAGSGREATVAARIWVGKNLKPRNDEGYVVFPTVRKHGPEFVAAWIRGLISHWVGTPFDVYKG